MKTAIAIRHLAFEDLGILQPLLQARGFRIEYREAGVDRLDGLALEQVDLLIALGGPIGAFDDELYPFLVDELGAIRRRLQARRPILGICLGAQLMARALGAGVAAMGHKEIGFAELQLTEAGMRSALAPLADSPLALHWHGDQFDIPDGAQRLAASARCPNQAFAIGNHALGLQFHLEADPQRLESWLVGHACELAAAGIDPRTLREQCRRHGEMLRRQGSLVFARWLDGLG
ncbi:glutamine amidotransferase [Chromobacterium sphagni]|uniref:Glutamine amidotransferase n=1 Tax=Chromobacterium sphagni TaxID=1903179 RepID=A0ABM6FER2_9NEIS|nr:glutamine amidotransferase [Chromobacterium sphagni]OHX19865.1 glutamine amidotransferase [Chromobacterium sphagni]